MHYHNKLDKYENRLSFINIDVFSISYISMLCYGAIEGGMDYDYVSSLNLKYIRFLSKSGYIFSDKIFI